MNLSSDEKDLIARQRQEFDDLQNEIGCRSTGRRARFLPDGPGSEEAKRKEREERAFQTRLAELLADPMYRAKYDATLDILRDAEQATDAALAALSGAIEHAETSLADMLDRAASLPDGSLVFRDAHGVVRREDGSVVADELAATILWAGDEPGFEAYLAQNDALIGLKADLDDLNTYNVDVLGSARDRMTDEDSPPSLDELDGILNGLTEQMPDVVKSLMSASDAPSQGIPDPTAIVIPILGGKP